MIDPSPRGHRYTRRAVGPGLREMHALGADVRTVSFGSTDRQVPNVVATMMRIRNHSDAQIRALYVAGRENGIDFFDHADLYGGDYHSCETGSPLPST